MQKTEELLQVGEFEPITGLIPEGTITVKEMIEEIGLSEIGYYSVFVNGKKADMESIITPQSEVIIIPIIAGG